MGYSKSKIAMTRMEGYLESLLLKKERIIWLSEDATKLVYRLHNAFYSAKYHRDSRYKHLGDEWKLKVLPDNKVEATPIRLRPEEQQIDDPLVINEEAISLLDIVAAHLKYGNATVRYKAARLSEEDRVKIEKWAKKNNYVISVAGMDDYLTIGPNEI